MDLDGKLLPIQQVRYEHLAQLQDCEEGYHLEYKLRLEDGGKAHLPKEVASFANCEGGWLIVGIDDKTRTVKAIEKQDYSQKIGKMILKVTPVPEFETNFITMPNSDNEGVLLVYVYEGRNAPYVCNGSIYIRSGSSKEPIKPADRGNIEYLYERSRIYEKEVLEFCKRDFYYPCVNFLFKRVECPIINIYLKNISCDYNKFLNTYSNRDEIINFIKDQFGCFESISYSMNSIIFMNKNILPKTNSGTFVFEVFHDWSCKIYVPLMCINDNDKEDVFQYFYDKCIEQNIIENFFVVDASNVFSCVFGGLNVFGKVAEKYKLMEKNYAYCIEIESANEAIMGFKGERYRQYIKEYGIPSAHKGNSKSKIYYLVDYPKVDFSRLSQSVVEDFLGPAFGFRSDDIFDIMCDSNIDLYD